MRVGLFTYHSEFTTGTYIGKAIEASGNECIRLGIKYPLAGGNPAPRLTELVNVNSLDLFLFVDPPGPIWPLGFEDISCPLAAYLIDVHQSIEIRLTYAAFFDVLFVAQRDYVSRFVQAGHANVYWLPLACDPEVHRRESPMRDIDVAFVGKMGMKGGDRYQTINAVLPNFRTSNFRKYYPPGEMASIYGRSKIVFNKSINGDLNMRVFEALASGALLVTDRIENGLDELFREGTHYAAYGTSAEAISKINYYLKNDKAREGIALTGQKLVTERDTYAIRWQRITDVVKELKVFEAPVRTMGEDNRIQAYAVIYRLLRKPAGIARLISKYGWRPRLLRWLLEATARKLNARIPVTPSAIKARLLP